MKDVEDGGESSPVCAILNTKLTFKLIDTLTNC